MLAYVLFGGMIATTWVQIVKAVLLLGGATLLALLVLARFGFNPLALFARPREQYGAGVLAPGRLVTDPLDAISLGLALMLGTAGLPHILMRFYTVPDARTARTSVGYATAFIGFFYLLTFVLGFGAMVHRRPRRDHRDRRRRQHGGAAARRGGRRHGVPRLHLRRGVRDDPRGRGRAHAVGRGGAVARPVGERRARTARPTSASSSLVARVATVLLAIVSIVLGIVFKGQNVAYMVGLAFAIAASANFPALVLSMFWSRFTTAGAQCEHARRHRRRRCC